MDIHPLRTMNARYHRFSLRHSAALTTLSTNRLLGFSATSIVGVFFPIFLFEFFGSIQLVLLWYVIDFAVKLPLYIFAAKLFSRIGLKISMAIGISGTILFYAVSYMLDQRVVDQSLILLGLAIVGLALVSAFYWSPFHVEFADLTVKSRRGKQLGKYFTAQRIIGVFGPLAGGFIIARHSYGAGFLFGILLLLLSFFPLMKLPVLKVKFEFGYFETIRKMFDKDFRNMSMAMMAHGAENIVGVVVWPIFLFLLFGGDYFEVGAFAAIIVVISLVLEILVGNESDKKEKGRLLKYGTGIYAIGWVTKAVASTVIGIFAASTFHSFGSILMRTPMSALMYEQAADAGHYIDEYTIIREMSLSIGRVIMLLLLIAITFYISISAAFIVAAIVSLGITKLSKRAFNK